MSFTDAIKTCLTQKYCSFQGRARRSEYWYFCLFNMVISAVLSFLFPGEDGVSTLSSLVSLALLLPGLGASVRRMHDIGKSGWALLVSLIPIVGLILLLVWACRDSQPGTNQYGPNPKEPAPTYYNNSYYNNY